MQMTILMKLTRAIETSYISWALLVLLLVFSLGSPSYSNAGSATTSEVISTTITNETVSTTDEITGSTSTSESEVIDTEVTQAGGIQTTTTTTEITTTTVDEVTTTTIVNQTTTTVTEYSAEVVEEKASTNYLTNSDFSSGTQGWTTSGVTDTNGSNGDYGTLSTGNQSSGGGTASQTVDLFDQMTQSEIQSGFDVKYGADVTSHPSNTVVPVCDNTSSTDCRDDFSITFTIADSLGNILHKFEHEYTGITFGDTQGFFFTQTIDPNNYTSAFATLELFGIDRGYYSGAFGPAFDNAVIQTYWNVINFITEQITTQVTEQITNVVVEYVTTVQVTEEVTSEDVFVGDPVQDIIDAIGDGGDFDIGTPDVGPMDTALDTAPDQGPDPEQPQEFTIEIQSPGGDPQTMTVEVRTDPEGEMTVEIKMDTQEPEQPQETQQEVARVDAEIEQRMEQQEQQSEQNQDPQEPEPEQQSEQNQDQQEPEPEQQEPEPEQQESEQDRQEPEQDQQESEQESETKTASKEESEEESNSESKNDSKEEKSDSNETNADLKQKIAEAVITNIIEQLGTDAASQATQLALMDRLGADLTATQVALSDNPTWYQDKPIYLDSGVVDNPQGRFITLIQEAQMDELIGSQYK